MNPKQCTVMTTWQTSMPTLIENWPTLVQYWAGLAQYEASSEKVRMLQNARYESIYQIASGIVESQPDRPTRLGVIQGDLANSQFTQFTGLFIEFKGFDKLDAFLWISRFSDGEIFLCWNFPSSLLNEAPQFHEILSSWESMTTEFSNTKKSKVQYIIDSGG